jgi:protein gp37
MRCGGAITVWMRTAASARGCSFTGARWRLSFENLCSRLTARGHSGQLLMSYASAIEWTQTTWNPVTGCTQVSPGCDHCYALNFAERFRGVVGHPYETGFDLTLRSARIELPLRWRQPRLIFVNSMSDLFHKDVPDEFIQRVFATMEAAHWHTFQVLTKRPQRAARVADQLPWPCNVWLGTSIETNAYLWRIDALRKVPAAVRFLSCEPLLGSLAGLNLRGIGWVITGGESGHGCRPPNVQWIREIRDICVSAEVPFFFKQWGGRYPKKGGRELDGRFWDEMPPFGVPWCGSEAGRQ